MSEGFLTKKAKRLSFVLSALFTRQNLAGRLTGAARGARHLSLSVRLADPTDLDKALALAEPLALAANTQAVVAERRTGQIVYQFELPPGFWENYTRADLPSPGAVGLAEQRRPVLFVLDPPHTLIAGTSGSGKSETVRSALVSLLQTNDPSALDLAIVDPHGDYGDFWNVAHLAIPMAQEEPEITTALTRLAGELAHRKGNNDRTAKRFVIVVDEAHEALRDDRNLAAIQALAQGRKFNMHLVLVIHKPLHKNLPNVLDNLDNRFVGKVVDAKVSATATGQAGLEAHKLTGKGDFLHVVGAKVERFQVAQATRQDIERLLRTDTPAPLSLADGQPIPDLPADLPDPPPPGRPRIEIDPVVLAHYFFHGPDQITRRIAQELFGMGRTGHDKHRDFCKQFAREYIRLRRQQNNKSLSLTQKIGE